MLTIVRSNRFLKDLRLAKKEVKYALIKYKRDGKYIEEILK